jgi:uncharacterized protein YkwD
VKKAIPLCLLLTAFLASERISGVPRQEKKIRLTEDERTLFDLINSERIKEGLPALKPQAQLFEAARAHAANMAKKAKLEHKLDGKSTVERVKATGYTYTIVAENLARGDVTLAEIVQAWMKSRSHRENILDADFTESGIGLARDGMGETYYAQIFAVPAK